MHRSAWRAENEAMRKDWLKNGIERKKNKQKQNDSISEANVLFIHSLRNVVFDEIVDDDKQSDVQLC